MLTQPKNLLTYFLFFIGYLAVTFTVFGSSAKTLENLHMGLEACNVTLSLLIALFLWDNIHATQQRGRHYLSICFGLAGLTGLLDAATDLEWSGRLAWVETYTPILRLGNWPLPTSVLSIGLIWSLWLIRRQSSLSLRIFILGMSAVALAMFLVVLHFPTYVNTGILRMQQPGQIPLILLWGVVCVVYWRERHLYPLFEGFVVMAGFMCVATIAMLFSSRPHDQFAAIAFIGKLLAYGTLNVTLMRKAMEDAQARAEAEHRLQVTLDSIGDGVITADIHNAVTYLNPAAEKMTGWTISEADGQPLNEVFHVVGQLSVPSHKGTMSADGVSTNKLNRNSVVLVRRDGTELTVEDSSALIYTDDGSIDGMVLTFRDVSVIHKVTAQLTYQAQHDDLTGLINRHELEAQLKASFTGIGRTHTLLHLNLDQFKIINDTYGNAAGDELLRQVAGQLAATVRVDDVLARLSGDEFAVLLFNCSLDRGKQVAEKFCLLIDQLKFEWQEKIFHTTVSIGLVYFIDAKDFNLDVMLAADTACHIAKDSGRNRVHVYRDDDKEVMLRHGELAWVERIHSALRENRLRLYRQEIVPVDSAIKEHKHYELLIRMLDMQGQIIAPGGFIAAAERYDVMPLIDRWVVCTAFAAYKKDSQEVWSINLSGESVNDDQFLEFIRTQFTKFGVPTSAICFEITETAVITHLSKASYFIRELHALGCSFSLDDFGSGMSSFGYLKYLPVDYLKIDGGFVKDMETNAIDYAMVEAINKIGQVMGLKTIAEFVENDHIRQHLKELGVNYAQGFCIHKPEPLPLQ
ncbi:MAG: EAL domain-containing protein [Candidatus Nitrotoga sp.]